MPLGQADKNSGHPSEPLLRGLSGLHGLVAVNKSADPGRTDCDSAMLVLSCRFFYDYLILRFGYPSHFAGTNKC